MKGYIEVSVTFSFLNDEFITMMMIMMDDYDHDDDD